jgi:hypothetical protein
MDAIEAVKAGKLDAQSATAIAKLAAQVSLSMQVEANIRADRLTMPKGFMGSLPIGEETPLIEG